MAPLLRWLQVNPGDDRATLEFVTALDRLTMMLRIAAVDPTTRERRFIALTADIQPGVAIGELERLDIEDTLERECTQNLRSRTLQYKRYATYVLRRLSILLGDDGAAVGDATIEHVLPRNPPAGSPWRTAFRTDKIIDDHTHRLGNLVLLSFAHNQEAGNLPFPAKQQIFAGSGFAIAREAANAPVWTREAIMDRTEQLARLLLASDADA